MVIIGAAVSIPVLASAGNPPQDEKALDTQIEEQEMVIEMDQAEIVAATNVKGSKAFSAAAVVGIAAAVGAISMGIAISKAVEGTARQPEAGSKIQTMLMLGLVFIETAIIYALIVAILIIFVL